MVSPGRFLCSFFVSRITFILITNANPICDHGRLILEIKLTYRFDCVDFQIIALITFISLFLINSNIQIGTPWNTTTCEYPYIQLASWGTINTLSSPSSPYLNKQIIIFPTLYTVPPPFTHPRPSVLWNYFLYSHFSLPGQYLQVEYERSEGVRTRG